MVVEVDRGGSAAVLGPWDGAPPGGQPVVCLRPRPECVAPLRGSVVEARCGRCGTSGLLPVVDPDAAVEGDAPPAVRLRIRFPAAGPDDPSIWLG